MTGPVQSLPMYFPPSPFSLPDALTCAALVNVAYEQCAQWINQGFPSSGNFNWQPPSASGYAYSPPVFWNYEWGFVEYNEPFGFVAQAANGDTFLVLRGTVTDADIYQDARVDQTPYGLAAEYGSVHAGFYTIYQSLSPQLRSIVASLSGVTRLLFAGHSLGSGLTTLAIPDILTNTWLQPSTVLPILQYNLASPRVGDPTFAGMMNGGPIPTYRIVNTEDIIPDGPPPVIGTLQYQHIGTPVDFTAQYGSIADNHSLLTAYTYALNNPSSPQGSPPERPLIASVPLPGAARVVLARSGV